MTNWKELGEVPDSEEEDGFDSQMTGSQEDLALGTQKRPKYDHDIDVWDFPLSQDEIVRPAVKLSAVKRRRAISLQWAVAC